MDTLAILDETEFRAKTLKDLCSDAQMMGLDPDPYIAQVTAMQIEFGDRQGWQLAMVALRTQMNADKQKANRHG